MALEIYLVGLFGREWTQRTAKTRKGYWLVSSAALVASIVISAKARQEREVRNQKYLSEGVQLKLV
ncbi:MAG: hypothetical protein AB2689_22785 [Candidatus Thiodiazotropha taylori]